MQLAIVAPDQTQPAESARKYQRCAGISNFINAPPNVPMSYLLDGMRGGKHGMGWDG